jgi:hypothetical protein
MGHHDVTFEGGVNAVATLGSFQIDIRHVRIVADTVPIDGALVVAHIDAVDMATGVFTLHIEVVGGGDQRQWETTKEDIE